MYSKKKKKEKEKKEKNEKKTILDCVLLALM
jgi:hypothetical protein